MVQAKKATYAAGSSAQKIVNDDQSKTLTFKLGDWEYNDNYFGGEPYGGREVVYYQNKIVYMMLYYGQVDKSISNIERIYSFLRDALKLIPLDNPYRGP